MRVGPNFKRPSKAVQRRERNEAGPKLFSAAEIRSMYYAATPPLRAMILLGINCGFGNMDCATLPIDRLDLDRGWHTFGRLKTGVERRCPLWPETIEALKAVLATRREAASDDDKPFVFLTSHGARWVRMTERPPKDPAIDPSPRFVRVDAVGLLFGRLQEAAGCKRPGVKFYTLRRTFRTIADEATDQAAAAYLMGHAPTEGDMSSIYRQRISDDRLRKVTDYVRAWLFPSPTVEKEG